MASSNSIFPKLWQPELALFILLIAIIANNDVRIQKFIQVWIIVLLNLFCEWRHAIELRDCHNVQRHHSKKGTTGFLLNVILPRALSSPVLSSSNSRQLSKTLPRSILAWGRLLLLLPFNWIHSWWANISYCLKRWLLFCFQLTTKLIYQFYL